MSHAHDHTTRRYDWPFRIGIALSIGFVVVEIGFGLLSDSLALMPDAGHNFSDVLGRWRSLPLGFPRDRGDRHSAALR